MPSKPMHTEPFQSGQQTNAKDKGEKTKIKSNMSKERNAGGPDPLSEAIAGRDSYIPSGMHIFVQPSFHPAGAHYTPMGEFGKPTMGGLNKTKATNSKQKGSNKKGESALGKALNQKGGNPLGGKGGSGTFRGRP